MSHIQDRLQSLKKAFQNFDTKEASFSDGGSHSGESTGSQTSESIASSRSAGSAASAESLASSGTGHIKTRPMAPLAPVNTEHPLEHSQPEQPPVATTTPKKKSSKLFWIVLIVIVLLVIFGLVLYHLYKKRKQNGPNKAKPKEGEKKKKQVRFGPSVNVNDDRPNATPDPFEQIDIVHSKVNPPRPVIRPPAPTIEEEDGQEQADLVPF